MFQKAVPTQNVTNPVSHPYFYFILIIHALIREIKSRISMEKAAFNKNKNPFTSKLKLNARNKSLNCYIQSIAFYGNGTWTLRDVDQQYMENSEMWC